MGAVSSSSGIALASRGATVLLFYVDTDGRTVCLRESTDYGATFSAPALLYTATPSMEWVAADLNESGVVALFFTVGSVVYVMKRSGSTWGSPVSWTNSLSSITGLACCYYGDWNVMVAGQDSSGDFQVATCVYGDGYSQSPGAWSALVKLAYANSGSGVEYRCPFVAMAEVFRTFFVERYTGAAYYSRPLWSYAAATGDYISCLWREPVPFNLASNYGLALAYSSTQAWLSTPYGVWRASFSPSPLDVSADLLALNLWEEPGFGRVDLELRNDGRYNTLGSGSVAAIKEGSEVRVSPGYHTGAGPRVSSGPGYWIEGWEYLSSGGRSSLVIHARDGWGLLERWRARRQYAWPSGSKNIFQLLSFILARAGLEYSTLSSSSALSDEYPPFTIQPGESGATAVKRLLEKVPDILFFRGHWAYSKNPQSGDATDYSYGADHPLIAGRYASYAPGTNRVQVYGSGIFKEVFSWPDLERAYDRLHQVHDLNLDSEARAQ
ncbi:MAG: hypothetical protein Q8O76_15740, partial [Chloroflexota bacterium]|nr:hypothetical protein [Chloroflexota bacterium]